MQSNCKMITTKVIPVKGSIPSKLVRHRKRKENLQYEPYPCIMKISDYISTCGSSHVDDSDGDKIDTSCHPISMSYKHKGKVHYPGSLNVVDYIHYRMNGFGKFQHQKINGGFWVQKLFNRLLFHSYAINFGDVNKIFSSLWLNRSQIIIGTKCNKIFVYNFNTGRVDRIPSLGGSQCNTFVRQEGGVHAIDMNPSHTLLATGALNCNDIAVYEVPSLDPVCVGENAHNDYIFDLCWLDDEFLVSGSRDTKLALWRIDSDRFVNVTSDYLDNFICEKSTLPSYGFLKPVKTESCEPPEKVRSIVFNNNVGEIITLGLNGFVYAWDTQKFCPRHHYRLPEKEENVCMAKSDDCSLYVVGSKNQAFILEPHALHTVRKINDFKRLSSASTSIRSLSFHDNIITLGTGSGAVMLYDVRACKILFNSSDNKMPMGLRCFSPSGDHLAAVYTHSYDSRLSKLFVAGGPLSMSLNGYYAAVWQ